METTLHQQLKRMYAPGAEANEVAVGDYRIDAVADDGRLIEVQCASLGAIRDKVRVLCRTHDVTVVKPVVVRKRIVKHAEKDGPVLSSRLSPKRETVLSVFEELVHFTSPFPHERLVLEVVEIEVAEHRVPRTRRRWRQKDHRVVDRELVELIHGHEFRRPEDFTCLLPSLVEPFTTGDLAEASGMPRWLAQKAAYFLREIGTWTVVGKQGNAVLYEMTDTARRAA